MNVNSTKQQLLGAGIEFAFDAHEMVSERFIKSADLNMSSRNLSYYRKQGLFFKDTLAEKGQHVIFNLTDYVWFQIVLELRKYDIGIQVIKDVKELFEESFPFEEFMTEIKDSEKFLESLPSEMRDEFLEVIHGGVDWKEVEQSVPVNLLSMILSEAIIKRKSVSILVNREGELQLYSLEDFDRLAENKTYLAFLEKTHINIPLAPFIKKFITAFDVYMLPRSIRILDEKESQIISYLREYKLSSLTVRLDEEHQINLIELEENYNKLEKEARLLDMILKNGYQTIEIKTQQGKVVHCKNIRKFKLG